MSDSPLDRRFDDSTNLGPGMTRRLSRRGFTLAAIGAAVTIRSGAAQPASPAVDQGDATELYRIELAAGLVPPGELVVGAVLQELAADTSVIYPVGSAPESLAIDYILGGGYEASSTSALSVIGEDGAITNVEPGSPVEVLAGEALVVVDNEEELTTVAGDEATVSLTLGFFTFAEGTGAVEIEGDLVSTFLGAPPPLELPVDGISVVLLEGSVDTADWPGAVVVLPVTSANPPAAWTFVILPLGAGAGAPVEATPVD